MRGSRDPFGSEARSRSQKTPPSEVFLIVQILYAPVVHVRIIVKYVSILSEGSV